MPAKPLFEPCDVWMGAMVPKRWAKRAVTRNAIKRQIYTVGTLAEPSLKQAAHVVRLRAGFDKAAYPSATSDALKSMVRQELVQLFARAGTAPQRMAELARHGGVPAGGLSVGQAVAQVLDRPPKIR